MQPDQAAALKALRESFPPESIGHRPTVTCKACSDSPSKVCDAKSHTRRNCRECGQYITSAHTHLDFVGHAHVRERLLDVDPEWNWEPLSVDDMGRPAFDGNGGMWIKLTVCSVTRLGYGDAPGKRGGNAIKEVIGDALRNAGQSFGIALDLWKKESKVVSPVEAEDRDEPALTPEQLVSQLRGQCMAIWRSRGGDAAGLADEYVTWSSSPDDPQGRDIAKEKDPKVFGNFYAYLRKKTTTSA